MGTSSSQNAETLISQRLEAVDKLRVDLLQKGTITFEQSALLESLVKAVQHGYVQIYVVNIYAKGEKVSLVAVVVTIIAVRWISMVVLFLSGAY